MLDLKPQSTAGTIKVLLTDTNRWALAARLAISLTEAGCEVYAVCPTPGHALLKTRAVKRTFSYSGFRPLESLTVAIDAVDPDLIIPSCDRGVGHLHELYKRAQARGRAGNKTTSLIERSLGLPGSHAVVSSRYDLLALARAEGVRVPHTAHLETNEQMQAWQASEPFPWVIKMDGTWGGGGVKIVRRHDDIPQALGQLERMFGLKRTLKRILVNRDTFGIRPWWTHSHHDVVVQAFVQGHPANCAVFCWQGRVLAGIGVEVVSTDGPTGPANVVRVVDNAEMMFAAERIAARLGLSGMFGLDFMIEEETGDAYLIEMNPRATPLCHFRLGKGRDMAGAVWGKLTGREVPDVPRSTSSDLIVYFPPTGDIDAELMQSCFLDEPKGEPELVQELMQPWPDRTLLFRLFSQSGKNQVSSGKNERVSESKETDRTRDYACQEAGGSGKSSSVSSDKTHAGGK